VLEACPEIVERLNGRGDEYVGHGRSNSERQDGLWEEDEARLIAEATEVVTRLTGRRPEGWLGPGLAESRATPDLLKEAGYRYVMDWGFDDQPVWMRTRSGPILSVPYPVEVNDLPALVFRRHTGRQFAEMIVDQFDELLDQSRKYPLVFAVALHPFVIGQPHRLRAFRDFNFSQWQIRASETPLWKHSEGYSAASEVNFTRPLDELWQLRFTSKATWRSTTSYFDLAQIGALYYTPDPRTATTFELGAFAPSDRSLKLAVYSVTLRVRRQIYRDWLYLEVTPQILYQEVNGFSATRSLMLNLETLFGDRYL